MTTKPNKLKEKSLLPWSHYSLLGLLHVINMYRSGLFFFLSKLKSACLAPSRALKLAEEPSQALSSPYQRLERQPLLNDRLLDLLTVKVQGTMILITALMGV